MKIALLGYGKMGKTIEKIALERGHSICLKASSTPSDAELSQADAAIDFSVPNAAFNNITKCFENKIPVACGTTGWLDQYKEAEEKCLHHQAKFIYASNFSLGVNLFFELNETLAKMMSKFEQYSVSMKEIHHTQKLDAPSGTAITLADQIIQHTNYKSWKHPAKNLQSTEIGIEVPDTLKYFCQSEAVAYYLQKYVVYRKRKIYVGKRTFDELMQIIKKHKEESYLLPSSDALKPAVPKSLDKAKIKWKRAIFYKTVISDLSHLEKVFYDVLVFFSPSGIKSLYENFPDFEQKDTKIAVFGNSTIKAAKEKGLKINIKAPTPETPSMTMALEKFIKGSENK